MLIYAQWHKTSTFSPFSSPKVSAARPLSQNLNPPPLKLSFPPPMSSSQAPMDNNDDGWDLFAVVRSCRTSSRPPPPPNPSPPPPEITPETMFSSCFPSLTTSGISHCDLERLCKPFFSTEALKTRPSSAPAKRQLSQSLARVKRGRSQQKKVVCQVPADGLAADMWAWRKYGQKPIKGSPFPRGYYRCSSSKGCLARKQVERSRSDAGMFVITYTGDHNHQIPTHRNSLAGSTRQKVPAAVQGNLPEGSPNTPLKREEEEEEEEDDEGVLLVEDMEVVGEDEVFFMGVEGLRGSPEVCSTTVFDGEFGGGELDGGFLVHPWSERRKDGR